VPLEEIGWDNPVFKMQHHPRFDIHDLIEED
jgi:hypothetical protein